jgi:hypothetical protein
MNLIDIIKQLRILKLSEIDYFLNMDRIILTRIHFQLLL